MRRRRSRRTVNPAEWQGEWVLVGIFLHLTPPPQRYPQVDRHNIVAQPNLCNISGRFAIFQRTATYRDWILDTISTGKEVACPLDRKFTAKHASSTPSSGGAPDASSSVNSVPIGRLFPWGSCPPKGQFAGANIADSFKTLYGEKPVRSKRNEQFYIDWNYNDGYSATSLWVCSRSRLLCISINCLTCPEMSGNGRKMSLISMHMIIVPFRQ